MGAGAVDLQNLLLPRGAPQPQQPPPQVPPAQAPAPTDASTMPASDTADPTKQLPPLPASDNTLEIPQQLPDPYTARPELINSIIQQESGGRPGAIGSDKVSMGLMQVTPATAAQYGIKDPKQLLNPDINREVGTRFFSDLLKKYKGNEFLALVAYNEGPSRLAKGQFLPQSVKYATQVLDRAGSRLKNIPPDVLASVGGGQPQMQFPAGMGPQAGQQPPPAGGGQPSIALPNFLQGGQPQGLQGGQPQLQIPPGMGQQPPQQQAAQVPPAGPAASALTQMYGAGAPGPQTTQQPPPMSGVMQSLADINKYISGPTPGLIVDPTEFATKFARDPQEAIKPTPGEVKRAGEWASGMVGEAGPEGAPRLFRTPRIAGYASDVGKQVAQDVAGQQPTIPQVEADIEQLSGRARGMIKRAVGFGVQPSSIGPLARRVRQGVMSEDQLSLALADLRKRLPPARKIAAVGRKFDEKVPVGLRNEIMKAVHEGRMPLAQAKKLLKVGTVGGVGAAVLGAGQPDQSENPLPSVPPEVQQQPGWLKRFGSGLDSLLEGTAYADEPPGTTPPVGGPAGAAPAAAATPDPAIMNFINSYPSASAAAAPPAAAPARRDPPMHATKSVVSPTGASTTFERDKLPVQSQVQELSGLTGRNQVTDALDAFKPLLPRMKKGEFSGPIWTREGLRMRVQPYAASHALAWQMMGGDQYIKLDPQVVHIYDKLGLITSSQLHNMIGGRIGAWATSQSGPLAPHLPNMQTDNLPRIYQKLVDMNNNMQIIQRSIDQFKAQGLSGTKMEDAVIKAGGGDPSKFPPESAVPPPPAGFE